MMRILDEDKYSEKLLVFNKSLDELNVLLSWWRSLSSIEKANPQKFTKLVSNGEEVKHDELRYVGL